MKTYPSSLGTLFLSEEAIDLISVFKEKIYSRIFILVDENTSRLCLPLILPYLPAHHIIQIPSGEKHKDLQRCIHIWTELTRLKADRSSLLINLGGGVITDIGGFAAGCYQRGIAYANIPTTLLAMTDASIGAKVGVDFEGFKNYLGLFQKPTWVWIHPAFLNTLPHIEILSGLTEVVKHAIIGGRELWAALQNMDNLNNIDWLFLLDRSLQVKLKIVESDPLDEGVRKTLNFGHTIGHALESHFLTTSAPMTHGQAVALGMIAESMIARKEGMLHQALFDEITLTIIRLTYLESIQIPSNEVLQPYLEGDKKNAFGKIRFSLPRNIGRCEFDIESSYWPEAVDWLREHVFTLRERLKSSVN